jgi:monovalent cation/proton antiporter MnhG/PhaG subunit
VTRDIVVHVLLALGVACQGVCCVGVLAMRNVFDRLHYSAGATTVGPLLIGLAIVFHRKLDAGGIEALVAVLLLFLISPVMTIATARAARRIDYGGTRPLPEEKGS